MLEIAFVTKFMPGTIDSVPLKYDKYPVSHDFCNVITAII
jgi:hypothetical protein